MERADLKKWDNIKKAIGRLSKLWDELDKCDYEAMVRQDVKTEMERWMRDVDVTLQVDRDTKRLRFQVSHPESEYSTGVYINYVFKHLTNPRTDTDPTERMLVAGYLRELADEMEKATKPRATDK